MVVPAHAYEVTGGDEGKGEDGLAPPAAAAVRHGARCRWSSRLPCRGRASWWPYPPSDKDVRLLALLSLLCLRSSGRKDYRRQRRPEAEVRNGYLSVVAAIPVSGWAQIEHRANISVIGTLLKWHFLRKLSFTTLLLLLRRSAKAEVWKMLELTGSVSYSRSFETKTNNSRYWGILPLLKWAQMYYKHMYACTGNKTPTSQRPQVKTATAAGWTNLKIKLRA